MTGQSRNTVCTYTRFSLNLKFPQLKGHDLNLLSQLLNELNSDTSKATSSSHFALSHHSSRLGIDIEELLRLEKAKPASSSTSSTSNSSSSSSDSDDDNGGDRAPEPSY
ncbi:uncharacterized protein JCM6883_001778 [Sporobolomyces salmoneus]|uniref:uncharacterized protein n=1 Tax=Sporobolomyces salmoneus TaxID=183962 RepID=UPI003176BEEB